MMKFLACAYEPRTQVYRAAAEKYAGAAALVASFDRGAGWKYLIAQGNELHDDGHEFGENQSLLRAIDVYLSALTLVPRNRVPLDWALTQNNLGLALRALGEREHGTAWLEEAISSWDACLTIASPAWLSEWIQAVRSKRDDTLAEIARRSAE